MATLRTDDEIEKDLESLIAFHLDKASRYTTMLNYARGNMREGIHHNGKSLNEDTKKLIHVVNRGGKRKPESPRYDLKSKLTLVFENTGYLLTSPFIMKAINDTFSDKRYDFNGFSSPFSQVVNKNPDSFRKYKANGSPFMYGLAKWFDADGKPIEDYLPPKNYGNEILETNERTE